MQDLKKYELAGEISGAALKEALRIAKPGMTLYELAERTEKFIFDKGAKPAFPANISANEIAAHYSPFFNDPAVIGEKDVLKIDVGAQVDGYIGDTAATIDFSGEHGDLVEAASDCLEDAVSAVKPGMGVGEIGAVIEGTAKAFGFKTVANLCGHSLARYTLHAGNEIPNTGGNYPGILQEGDVFAIEPFVTNGAGLVSDGSYIEIFSLVDSVPVRQRESKRLLTHIESNYRNLPFALRWLRNDFRSSLLLNSAIRELILRDCVRPYPVLHEVKKGLVSQFEHTIVVEHDGARILTKR